MQITAISLQDFDIQLKESGWNPPIKSNSFHLIKKIGLDGSINLFADIAPKLNSDNFIVDNNNVPVSMTEDDVVYYVIYDMDTKTYHPVIGDPYDEYEILPDTIRYGDVKVKFPTMGWVNVYQVSTHGGKCPTGEFTINGEGRYRSLTVIADTKLILDDELTVSDTVMSVHGEFEMESGSVLTLTNNATLIIYSDGIFDVPDDITVNIDDSSKIEIYGTVNISQSHMGNIDKPNVYIDTSGVLNVTDIPTDGREYSLTDYESDLRDDVINVYNQSQHHSGIADIGYTWAGGNPTTKSQIIDMEVLYGTAVLGDYKLSVLGTQETMVSNRQFVRRLIIYRNTELYITESFQDGKYYNPELYLGTTIGNTGVPGMCICYGSMIVDGINCKITIDRHAYLHIGEFGSVTLSNGARMISANNGNSVALRIDGVLTIDTLDQLVGFDPEHIEFGENGKLVILNPSTDVRTLLWTTPNGIKNTELYRLFVDDDEYDDDKHELAHSRLRHVEYHINANNGIGVDQAFENYAVYMTQWYNGMRLERAIHEGLIVWHAGGFIELYNEVDPNINTDCTLYDASKFFKHYGVTKNAILQDVANRFKYAGAEDIVFRFYESDTVYKDAKMTLDAVTMMSTSHLPTGENMYNVNTDNNGTMFLRNRVTTISADTIIQNDSVHHALVPGDNVITIE